MSPRVLLKQALLVTLALALVALAAAPSSTEAAKKKPRKNKNKKRRFQDAPASCGLSYGLKQAQCNAIAAKCGVVWVGTCGPNDNGRGGCQKIGDCPRMQCQTTCAAAHGDDLVGGGCKWENGACYKECFVGVGTFGSITNGQDFQVLQDTVVEANAATSASGVRPSSGNKGEWYYRYVASGPGNNADSSSIGLYQLNTVTANLSQTFLSPVLGGLPGGVPGYAWISSGHIISTLAPVKEVYAGGAYVAGDVIGVHYNGTNIWFSKNGVNQPVAYPSALLPGALNTTFPYVGMAQGHHAGTKITCIPQ